MADGQDGAGQTSFTGWIRADSDHVLRGWVTDRAAREVRAQVAIAIDGQEVARVVADRLDPKLVELGEGDGRYAFAVVIPPLFRDGAEHAFEATVVDGGFRLKSKVHAFETPETARAPRLHVGSIRFPLVKGALEGGLYSKSTTFDLWSGDRRLMSDLPTSLSGPAGAQTFTVHLPPDLARRGLARLRIAAPGMVEAGLDGGVIDFEISASAAIGADGAVEVGVEAPPGLLEEETVELAFYAAGETEPAAVQTVTIQGGVAAAATPADLRDRLERVALRTVGQLEPFVEAPVRRSLHALTRNGSFEAWRGAEPVEWETPAPAMLSRGFYAFPERVVDEYGVTGDFVHAELGTGGDGTVILRQAIGPVSRGQLLDAAVLFRADTAAALSLRLIADGETLAAWQANCSRGWAWTFEAGTILVPADAPSAAIEVVAEKTGGCVDLAGIRLGGSSFRVPSRKEPPPVNLVASPGLDRWPGGIAFTMGKGRREAAQDWFVVNRSGAGQVRVSALVGDQDLESPAFAFAGEKTECRLEILLDRERTAKLTEGTLSLEIGAPAAARRLLRQARAAAPQFQAIERIMLLRRRVGPDGAPKDETVATIARRLLVTDRFHRLELPFEVRADRRSSEFAWDDAESAEGERWLALEMRGPFAIALRGVSLRGAASAASPTPGGLALEDRNIAAQVEQVRGLAGWLSPQLARPAAAVEPPAKPAPKRWRWGAGELGTVEIVICVHNAPADTLACLESLVGSTEAPHTVSILDDASAPQTARQLESFIVGKPWMRLTRQDQNRGYTATADRGVREADADWVVLLNSDTIVSAGWLEGLMEAAASKARVAMVGPMSNAASFQSAPEVFDPAGGFAVNKLPPGFTPHQMAALVERVSEKAFPEAPLLNGFCTLIRREAFLEVGGLNTAAFPEGYGEENDLCLRIAKAGWALVVADHVYVHHTKSMSFGSARRVELARAGSAALRALHPDVEVQALTERFSQLPALVRLRAAVREQLAAVLSERVG